ncbi:transposase domain-containing protein [Streptomyces sp. NPDC005374]|uniref:transposase domain-containing protein n=1 Tax=Streptomyces sp. NPDC005374 TaxID=3364713 RepID=UPI0036978D72
MVPFELVDAVPAKMRRVQQRPRDLPSRVRMYFLLEVCLFPEVGYQPVWDKPAGPRRTRRPCGI